jgi:hypothetical protein
MASLRYPMAPLTAQELQKHPEYDHTIWKLDPDHHGTAPVAKDRGGPIDIAYEVHGHGPRRIVVGATFSDTMSLCYKHCHTLV